MTPQSLFTRDASSSRRPGAAFCRALKSSALALTVAAFCGGTGASLAQTPVAAGSGSYASFPPSHEGVDDFVYNQPIYVSPGETRPIPSNEWWTDLIISQYSGNLWAYPLVANCEDFGFDLYLPMGWNAGGNDMLVQNPLRIGGNGFAPTEAIAKDWSDSTVLVGMPDGAQNMDLTLAHGMPYVWVQSTAMNPEIRFTEGVQLKNSAGAAISLPQTGGSLAIQTSSGRIYGLHVADNAVMEITGQQWVRIDLGAVTNITRLNLLWEAAYGKGYKVQTSNDGNAWADIYTETNGNGGTDDFNVSGSGRYVRILMTERGTQWAYSLWEVSIYNGATLVSLGDPVLASSSAVSYQPVNLNDGNPGTRWQAEAAVEEKLIINVNNGNTFFAISALTAVSDLATYHTHAYNRPTGTQVSYTYNPTAGTLATTWAVTTQNLKTGSAAGDVIQGFLPHHYKYTTQGFSFASQQYETSRGDLRMAIGKNYGITYAMKGVPAHYVAPYVAAGDTTPYSPAIQYQMVTKFAAKTSYGGDTYWGGKDLVNFAKYTLMAKNLNHQAYNILAARTREALVNWLTYTPGETEKYFAWYPRWKALVGFNESYGSAQFTDNHFHYGYLIHAAALYGMVDQDFLNQYGDILKMVAKQYANWSRTDPNFPHFRTMDIWMGHSYAGGTSSGTGNNQESTSEAMQSWIGVFLLGNALNDNDMRAAGAFGYTAESAATLEYWFDWDDQNFPSVYPHSMVGILWPGGYSYGTFFSASPVHIHGIQYLPVAPGFDYFARNKTWAASEYAALMSESLAVDGYTDEAQFGQDWANVALGFRLLYDAPYVTQKLQAYWNTSSPVVNDDTAGMTYYYAHANQNLGERSFSHHTNLAASAVYNKGGQLTAIAYNPSASAQTCNIYNASGGVVRSFSVPAKSWVADPANPGSGQPPAGGYKLLVANATASSGNPEAAVDGNPGSRWESAFSDPQWITLDMGGSVTANRIVLTWETANSKDYVIEGSNDGSSWSLIATRTNMPAGPRTDTIDNLTATYRYFRLTGTARNGVWGHSIFEFEVWGTVPSGPPPATNLVLEAEDYDAAFDTSAGNAGGQYRTDDVDIEVCAEGGFNVGWTATGEWLDFDVDVAAAGSYNVVFRVSSPYTGTQVQLRNSAGTVLGTATNPQTGGWQSWQDATTTVNLPAGPQTLRVYCVSGGFNLNRINIGQ